MATKGKIAVLLGDGFEDSEFRIPVDRLSDAGYAIEIIGAKEGQALAGKKGKEKVKADLGIDDARFEDYAALVIPGGYSPDHLRIDDRFVRFIKDFNGTGRPLAAVCHGPQLLITAGLVEGRTLTAWPTIQVDLGYAGARVRDEEVVVDDNWITSRKPEDLEAFSSKILEELAGQEERSARMETNEGAQPQA